MRNLSRRLIHKLIRETSPYLDSHSLYFNAPPHRNRLARLSEFGLIGEAVHIEKRVSVPTPAFLEIGSRARLRSLRVAPDTPLLIEPDVTAGDVVSPGPCILTGHRTYEGRASSANRLTVSVDMEGGVALSHASPEAWDRLARFWDSRKAVEQLAGLFQRYEIPVTWAVCGHLFLKECNGKHGVEESDGFGDWFRHDPATNHLRDPSWYMPEQIQRLAEEPLFEIGYHSFGHFRYQACSRQTVETDIRFAEQIRKDWGLALETFVFPYNRAAHLDLLSTQGRFRTFRGSIGRLYPAYGHIDFSDFRFFHTTQMFAPDTMDVCMRQLPVLDRHAFNYYTHCYQWLEKDGWKRLEDWLLGLATKRDRGVVELAWMKDVAD